MNNLTAHINFKVVLDKNSNGVAYGGSPAFLPEEEDMFLNQAYIEVISNKLNGTNALKIGFEGNLSRTSELDAIIRTDENVFATNKEFNEFILNDVHDSGNRMIILQVAAYLGDKLVNCKFKDHFEAEKYKETYDNVPWIEHPVFSLENNSLLLYVDPIQMEDTNFAPATDGYRLKITYVKKPIPFDYTKPEDELELPDDVIMEVINRAAVIALENIESQRTANKLQLNNLSE